MPNPYSLIPNVRITNYIPSLPFVPYMCCS